MQTLDVSIIKSTNHNKVPPKEKHIKGTEWRLRIQAVYRFLFVQESTFRLAGGMLCALGKTSATRHHQVFV